MHRKSLEVEQQVGSKEGISRQYCNLGHIQMLRGDLAGAEASHRKMLEIAEELGLTGGMASEYGNLGVICRMGRGELAEAEALHRKRWRLISSSADWRKRPTTTATSASSMQSEARLHRLGRLGRSRVTFSARMGMRDKLEKVQDWLNGLTAESVCQGAPKPSHSEAPENQPP